MNKKIYDKIKSYNTIVIARHIGADPDALASQLSLREAIKLTFPDKKVYAVGGSSSKFNYFPKLDKKDDFKDALLIVVDTPDKKRVDITTSLDEFKYKIKIDHHPFIEEYCDLELIKDDASSASELIFDLIKDTPLLINERIASILFMGIVSDTERFLFNSSPELFIKVSKLLKEYNLNTEELYRNIFKRPLNEVRLQGFIAENLVVNKHGLGYIFISDEVMKSLNVDSGSAGNLIDSFSNIEETIVRVFFSEDIKNNIIKVNIRSNGPVINTVAEKYNGGGHKFASGIKLSDVKDVKKVLKDLDDVCKNYKKELRSKDENK